MSIRRSHPNFFLVIAGTAVAWLAIGLAYAAGPDEWRSSPAFDVITRTLPWHDARTDFQVAGVVMATLGALILVGLRGDFRVARVCLSLGAAVAITWAVGIAWAATEHKLQGAAGPVLWGYFGLSQIAQASEPVRNPATAR